MKIKLTREPAEASCASLNSLIVNEPDSAKRDIYMFDLLNKASALLPARRNEVLAKGFTSYLPDELRNVAMPTLAVEPRDAISDIDVAIVTVKKPELLAAKLAFGVSNAEATPRIVKGFHFFQGEFPNQRYQAEPYTFVLTAVGDDRNVPCSNCVNALLAAFRPKVMVLIGMAAGNKEKVSLGDVVVAEAIIDVGGGRVEPTGKLARPDTFTIGNLSRSQLTNYDVESWASLFKKKVKDLTKTHEAPPDTANWMPQFRQATILSSEDVVVDDSLEALREQRHEQAIALDMESSGFAQACITNEIPWFVFRGISDYGESLSKNGTQPRDPRRKNWQPYASLAAACIARDFLATRYKAGSF